MRGVRKEVAAAMFLKTQFQETADMKFILGAYEKRLVMFIMTCGSQEIPHQVSILLCRVIVRAELQLLFVIVFFIKIFPTK